MWSGDFTYWQVVDENGKIVPRNTKGELYTRSYMNFIEYKDEPELTRETLSPEGWVKSG